MISLIILKYAAESRKGVKCVKTSSTLIFVAISNIFRNGVINNPIIISEKFNLVRLIIFPLYILHYEYYQFLLLRKIIILIIE